jgi:Na+-transporting NADH:ubiquinone oxidoreductase subunit A
MLIAALVTVVILLVLASVFSISDNILQIEAQKQGVDTSKKNLGIFPSFSEVFGKPVPEYAEKRNFHRLTKGFDILLAGEAEGPVIDASVTRYALKPGDFRGIAPIPKVEIQEGDEIKAGEPVFFDKSDPSIKYVAPVSGEFVELRRGEKRSIKHLIILADKEQKFYKHSIPSADVSREELIEYFKKTGAWVLFNQRPFDVIADPSYTPANIFISCFDTSPLAIDPNLIVEERKEDLQPAIDALNKLTDGKVYFGLDGRSGHKPHDALVNANGVEKHWFTGKHPAGNVGIHIHHIAPIRGNDVVWTLKLEDLLVIGKLMREGVYDTTRIVGLCGSKMVEPKLLRTRLGASLHDLLKDNLNSTEDSRARVILGNVLSGSQAEDDDFLGMRTNVITAIEEGDSYELFGWLLPLKPRPSISKTYPNFLISNHKFQADTNTHGEQRAFVVTGQYEKMLPMDIYPQHLMKAILTGDIERMEALGINELTEEDLALAEFSCTSKQPLQEILRDGLEMMREQA